MGDSDDEQSAATRLLFERSSQSLLPNKSTQRPAAAAAAAAAASAAEMAEFDTRRRLTTAFGAMATGTADLIARALCDSSKEEDVDRLPPTLAHPAGTRLSSEEDLVAAKATLQYDSDWRNTLLIGALPSMLVFDTKAIADTSLECAIIRRAVEAGGRDGHDDDAVVVACTGQTLSIRRAALLDVIFRWRKGGGSTADAPASLAAVVSCALDPKTNNADTADNTHLLSSRDKYKSCGVFLKPVFNVAGATLPLEDAFSSGAAPMSLVLLRACCLYTRAIHVALTWRSPHRGKDMPLTRMYTNHVEDDFLQQLFTPRAVPSEMSLRGARTMHGIDLRVDTSPALTKLARDDAVRVRTLVCQGRSSQTSDPLSAPHVHKFVQHVDFSVCVAIANATLECTEPPRDLVSSADFPWRWIRGRPLALEDAVARLARTPLRAERLYEFWCADRKDGKRAESEMVILAFENHASLGLAVVKRALHTMTNVLHKNASAADAKKTPWYVCIPYMRHDVALPAYLVMAQRSLFVAANAAYGLVDDTVAASCQLWVQPMHGAKHAKTCVFWESASLFNERELRDFCAEWPTAFTDPGEFYPAETRPAIDEFATSLRKYMCVTQTAVNERLARELCT